MRLSRWDAVTVAGAAALSAAVFGGFGRHWAEAGGKLQQKRAVSLTAPGKIGGCEMSGKVVGKAIAGRDSVLAVHVKNPGSSAVKLDFTIVVEKLAFNRQITMSRMPMPRTMLLNTSTKAPNGGAKATVIARKNFAIEVKNGQAVKARARFNLPAGTYNVYATGPAGAPKRVPLCMLTVRSAPKPKKA